MKTQLKKLIHCEKGVTALEYALIAALISIAAITGIRGVSGGINTTYSQVTTAVTP